MSGSPSPSDYGAVLVQLQALKDDIGEIKSAMKSMSEALFKLALVEERQANTAAALERAFGEVRTLQARVATLETLHASTKHTSRWVDRGVWAIVSGACVYAGKKLGVIP